jgi:hypothetical protein
MSLTLGPWWLHTCYSQIMQFQINSSNCRFLCKKQWYERMLYNFFDYQFARLSAKCKMFIFCCCLMFPIHIPTPVTFSHLLPSSHCPFTDNGCSSHCIHRGGDL